MPPSAEIRKRIFDLGVAFLVLLLFGWIILIAWVIAALETGSNGFFIQSRVGRNGRIFKIFKIKTMRNDQDNKTTVTHSGDNRVTRSGLVFRRLKIDELPQIWNVLIGDMSIVGPRPDVSGYADKLRGEDRIILSIRPGITGPATLKYRNEEAILGQQSNPEEYNRNVIWPDKVQINLNYCREWTLWGDVKYIVKTLIG